MWTESMGMLLLLFVNFKVCYSASDDWQWFEAHLSEIVNVVWKVKLISATKWADTLIELT